MSAVQITGCSGAGKTTIAAVLVRRGLAAIDADDDPLLARTVDAAGNVVEQEPEEPDLAWLSRHSWAWNPARLDELIRAAAPATLHVCGGADNELEVAGRFTQVFLLEIDEPTMLARLDARRDYHDWRRIGDTREYLRRKLPELQDRLRASGRSPLTPGSPSTKWRTRYSPIRWLAPPRAKPASRAISPAPDPRNRQASPEDDLSTISYGRRGRRAEPPVAQCMMPRCVPRAIGDSLGCVLAGTPDDHPMAHLREPGGEIWLEPQVPETVPLATSDLK
jgi:adenylate kinase family enzyme